MQRLLVCLFALCLIGACGLDPPSSTGAEATEPELPAPPIQRCINLSNALEAPREGEWGYTVRQRDLATIAEAGFDTVRLPVKASAHALDRPPYTIDPALLARIDEIVGWAGEAGLQIIIDVHHYDEINEAPEAHLARLLNIWDQLARHYQGAPETVIFEVLNEPHSRLTVDRTDSLMGQALATIRYSNPRRWVITGSAEWGNLEAWLEADPPRAHHSVTGFHYYTPWEFTHQQASWLDDPPPRRNWGSQAEREAVRRDFERAGARARVLGLPVFVGEFGAVTAAPREARLAWLDEVRRAAEAEGFGWCHWGFAADFAAYDIEAEAWDEGVLAALGLTGR